MEKVKNITFITLFILLLPCILTGCGADGTDSISAEQSVLPDAVTEETLQESEADFTGQESVQDIQEEVETSETESTTESVTETSEMPTEEIDDLYGFGPISYDLSTLPDMENKLYAEWNGNIYFRRYSDEDIEKGALWANFGDIPDTEKELMCLTPDGELTQVGTDYGCGTMFIVNGRLYSQRRTMQQTGSNSFSYYTVVYSCKLDGSDVREYAASKVLAVRNDKVICEMPESEFICKLRGVDTDDGLSVIDAQTGREQILVDATSYSFPHFLGATEEEIFYYTHRGTYDDFDRSNSGADEELVLYSVDYEGNIRELATVTGEEYLEYGSGIMYGFPMDTAIYIHYFKILGDDIYFSAGADNGSARMYSGGPIFSMKKDGSERKVEALSYDDIFYLYDDGINRALLCSTIDASTGRVAENGKMMSINLIGDGDKARNITLRPAYGYPYDEAYVYSSTAYDPLDHSVYPDTSVLLYPDTSGICYVLLTEQDCEELSVDTYVDGSFNQDIKDVEYLDGKLFFTVTDLTYSMEDSIGWRDGYVRGRTACYYKNLESGKISLLYEY